MQDHEAPRPSDDQPSTFTRWVFGGAVLLGIAAAAALLWLVFGRAKASAPPSATKAPQNLPGGLTREQLAIIAGNDDNESRKKSKQTADDAAQAKRDKAKADQRARESERAEADERAEEREGDGPSTPPDQQER